MSSAGMTQFQSSILIETGLPQSSLVLEHLNHNKQETIHMEHPYHLRYNKPADAWQDAMPLGNGRLGAMVYGHTTIDRIQLNDDSLWYGKFIDRNNQSLKDKLPEIRRLVLSGDIYHAEELIMQYMAGTPGCMRHYTLLGELDIALISACRLRWGGCRTAPVLPTIPPIST
jgi:hypothetical protein